VTHSHVNERERKPHDRCLTPTPPLPNGKSLVMKQETLPRVLLASILVLGCTLVSLHSTSADAQTSTPDNATLTELHERVDNFLNSLGDLATARRAVEQIVEDGPLERQANTTKLIEQVEQFSSRYGIYLSSERVSARLVGRDLVMMTYLYKTDQFPVIWRFTFYRPPTRGVEPSTWRIVSISFDTNYQLLELSLGNGTPRPIP